MWVNAVGFGLFTISIVPAVWAVLTGDWKPRLLWFVPALVGLSCLRGLRLYSKGSPNCPHCQRDITNCAAAFCHSCGQTLRASPCERCGADPNWTAGFQAFG